MAKYIYRRCDNGDEYDFESDDLKEVARHARDDWWHLADSEKKRCDYAFYGESANPDDEAENHLDCDVIADLKQEWIEEQHRLYNEVQEEEDD